MGRPAEVQGVIEFGHRSVTLVIAERKNLLKGQANMGEIFLDVGPPVILALKVKLMLEVVRQSPRALLQAEFYLFD